MTMLPPNATTTELHLEAVTARISDVDVPLADLWNPAACPEELLPWLAYALRVPVWESTWSTPTKRAVLGEARQLNTKKGTPWSVSRSLYLVLGGEAGIIEHGHQPVPIADGTHLADGSVRAGRFRHWADFEVHQPNLHDAAAVESAHHIIKSMKPLRSRLVELAAVVDVDQSAELTISADTQLEAELGTVYLADGSQTAGASVVAGLNWEAL